MATSPYLSVDEVSGELGISKSGVYKLIQRGKLRAIKRSERGTLVPRLALDAYRRQLESSGPRGASATGDARDVEDLVSAFSHETGSSPEDWIDAWKADQLEDSVANMRHTIRALAILAARRTGSISGAADGVRLVSVRESG